jgi:hypothetical protein
MTERKPLQYPPVRTAGEVRFVKDQGPQEWAWAGSKDGARTILPGFSFDADQMKPLSKSLRSALMAMGHALRAHEAFVKLKSSSVSPDGSLGGRGYVLKISDMRRMLMNTIEALSAFTDTMYDEINAPHWHLDQTSDVRDRQEVKEILQESEAIRQDPEGWAQQEEAEPFNFEPASATTTDSPRNKTASAMHLRQAKLVAAYFGVSP